MIQHIYPTQVDFTNLSLKRTTESNGDLTEVDYKHLVVNKPWGYEYLIFENEFVAIWVLYLKCGAGTSMHCHPKKRTSLAVLSGSVVTTTLESEYSLDCLGGIILESGVFHSTRATSEAGAFIMEIETPPNKKDLVRLKDEYGRVNSGYEGASEISSDLSEYEYFDFHNFDPNSFETHLNSIRDSNISIHQHKSLSDLHTKIENHKDFLLCILDRKLTNLKSNLIIDLGNLVLGKDLRKHKKNLIADGSITALTIQLRQKN